MGDDSTGRPAKVRVRDKRRSIAGDEKAAGDPTPAQVGAPGTVESEVEVQEPDSPTPESVGSPMPEASDYLEDLRRLQAEFENYRKRMMRDQTRVTERASARLIERLLPVLDSFDKAIDHGDVSSGVELVYKELHRVLADEGLEEIPAKGLPFDPTIHEAVESREDPDVSETRCVTVYRPGYRVGNQVLRPAMVGVARPADSAEDRRPRSALEEDEAQRVEADGG
jgi:molecular chaperone GrpE